ncbi:MAG: NusG domain II-containing protein [Clostridia bacterium]
MNKTHFRKADFIAIISILLLALLISSSILFFNLGQKSDSILIFHDQQLLVELKLAPTPQVFKFSGTYGKMQVTYAKSGVSVTSSTCPDQICVIHSAIHKDGESIICIPNKVVVKYSSR